MKSLKELLGFCKHKWVAVKEFNLTNTFHSSIVVGKIYVMQCEKCGNIKHTQLNITRS